MKTKKYEMEFNKNKIRLPVKNVKIQLKSLAKLLYILLELKTKSFTCKKLNISSKIFKNKKYNIKHH